ncbi:hypothetical protein G7B21_29350, partial [Klebsiella pneumoniae]|nr:hypothetical protein [Klebsiella pneumoniae]
LSASARWWKPPIYRALRRLGDVIDRCQGYDLDLLCRLVLSASARWWKPPIYRALRRLGDVIDRCQGYDLD